MAGNEIKKCPYCKSRPLLKKTCGNFTCQFKRHILKMRERPKKTKVVRKSRRIEI